MQGCRKSAVAEHPQGLHNKVESCWIFQRTRKAHKSIFILQKDAPATVEQPDSPSQPCCSDSVPLQVMLVLVKSFSAFAALLRPVAPDGIHPNSDLPFLQSTSANRCRETLPRLMLLTKQCNTSIPLCR